MRLQALKSSSRTMVVFTAAAAIGLIAAIAGHVAEVAASNTPSAATEPAIPRLGELFVRPHGTEPRTMMMFWTGKIEPGMAQQIAKAFEAHRQHATRFVLVLSSGGGSVREGEAVIAQLRTIKASHRLDTLVLNGQMCGSMCVYVFLQGQTRFAAPSSSWLFHEVATRETKPGEPVVIDRIASERLVATYFRPAGVSTTWAEQMKPNTINADFWQSGAELVAAKSGIVTTLTPAVVPRAVVAPATASAHASPAASGSGTGSGAGSSSASGAGKAD